MPVKKANAKWSGTLKEGSGEMFVESGAYEGEFSFAKRFGDEPGTNPEELIGAAHAGCYSMAFSNELDGAGFTPESVETTAEVHLEDAAIVRIHLTCEASVGGGISEEEFQEIATQAKENCPVSVALAGVDEITLDATLV